MRLFGESKRSLRQRMARERNQVAELLLRICDYVGSARTAVESKAALAHSNAERFVAERHASIAERELKGLRDVLSDYELPTESGLLRSCLSASEAIKQAMVLGSENASEEE